ncbi:MAG TPA: pyridoxal phosphate-dependent aminotransferase [Polyangiaceae bacterium]|nr:pyridoxal phosphate-dependent aminotransferase [Polyangiaceae bacterium]
MSQRSPRLSRSASLIRAGVFAELAPRIEAQARRGADLIGLHIGDSHRAPPEAARFARLEEGLGFDADLYRYANVVGLDGLRGSLVAHLAARGHGPSSVDPVREVLVGCGASHALFCAARAILDAGDEVLVAAPYWPLAVGVVRAAGAVPVEVVLTTRLYDDPSLDAASLFEEALSPRTRAIYLTTPGNPDGKVLSAAQLTSLARFAIAHDLWVIADEVYADYVYDGEHVSIAGFDEMRERTLSVYSLSKSYALAGVRVGFVVGPERAVSVARRLATHTVFNVPLAAQRVALAAMSASAEWIDGARREYRNVRDVAVRALREAGVAAPVPEGGSYIFVNFAPILRGRPLRHLLEMAIDRGVLLAPGDGFGQDFTSWARICFTVVPPSRVLEGIERLNEAIVTFAR